MERQRARDLGGITSLELVPVRAAAGARRLWSVTGLTGACAGPQDTGEVTVPLGASLGPSRHVTLQAPASVSSEDSPKFAARKLFDEDLQGARAARTLAHGRSYRPQPVSCVGRRAHRRWQPQAADRDVAAAGPTATQERHLERHLAGLGSQAMQQRSTHENSRPLAA